MALSEASRLYQNTLGPQAPNRESFTRYTPASVQATPNNDGRGGYNYLKTPAKTVFDEAGYNAALQNYQSQPTYVDPVASSIIRYQNALSDTPLENTTYNALTDTVGGQYLQGNPYIESMIGRTNAGINANFSQAGRYGSGAHAGYLAEAGNALRYQNYNDERARMMQAAALAPQGSALRFQPYELGINLAQELEDVPVNRAARYVDLLNAVSSGGGSVTSPIYRNRTAGAAGGAMAGLAMGGPITGLVGAGLGYMLS